MPSCPHTTTTTTATLSVEMSSIDSNPLSTEQTPSVDDDRPFPQLSQSFLDELQQEDEDDSIITYSYYSTWSSNYTESNLPGPGRLLGNFYSWAGLALERRLERLLNRGRLGAEAEASKVEEEAVAMLQASICGMIWSDDTREIEKVCETLIICAQYVSKLKFVLPFIADTRFYRSDRSKDIDIQVQAFAWIVGCSVERPSKARSAFANTFQRRNEISDLVAFSWKRPGPKYSVAWLYWYKLASRCLSTLSVLLVEAAMQRNAFQSPFVFSMF